MGGQSEPGFICPYPEMIRVFLVEEFIERLPFQAIRCSLAEVVPVKKEWSSEAGDRLFDLTRELETDEAMLVERIEAGSVGVVIMLERQGKFSTVNQRLLEEGCAVSSLFGSYAGTDEVRDSGMVNDWDSSKDEYYVFGPRPGSLPLSGNLSLI